MKTIKSLLIVCLLSAGLSSNAQYTETRQYVKRYKIQPETRIDITNKYGKIEIDTWDKDSVVIDVHMKIEEKKASKLEKTLDNLDFDVTNSKYYLIVKTQIDKNMSQIESEFLKFKETLLQTDGSIEIDLHVFMPDNHELRLENKFGDIIMGSYNGETNIDLSNGKLKAHSFTKKTNISLNFADANISSLSAGRLNINYSDLYLKECGQLRIESKSSDIEILKARDLVIDSRRDKFRVRITDEIEADGSFSHFIINELRTRSNMRLSYGDLDIEKILNDFTNMYIESRSTDLNLYFHPDSKFNLEITETKTEMDLGRSVSIEEEETLDSKERKIFHSGFYGKNTEGEKKLIINSTSGEINISSY